MKWYGWPRGQAPRGELKAAVVRPRYRRADGREVADLLDWDGEAFTSLADARMALVAEMRRSQCSGPDCLAAALIKAVDVPMVHDYRVGVARAAGSGGRAERLGPACRDRYEGDGDA